MKRPSEGMKLIAENAAHMDDAARQLHQAS